VSTTKKIREIKVNIPIYNDTDSFSGKVSILSGCSVLDVGAMDGTDIGIVPDFFDREMSRSQSAVNFSLRMTVGTRFFVRFVRDPLFDDGFGADVFAYSRNGLEPEIGILTEIAETRQQVGNLPIPFVFRLTVVIEIDDQIHFHYFFFLLSLNLKTVL
jgi:hypothetical protein